MNYKEEMTWILDKANQSIDEETKYKLNIDFVHSLGKKCDCVGWSTLKMDESDADEILDRLKSFAKKMVGALAPGILVHIQARVIGMN